jgi:hypothetical protein
MVLELHCRRFDLAKEVKEDFLEEVILRSKSIQVLPGKE